MANYRTQILSTRPAAEIFAYMADFSNAAEWDPGVTAASRSGSGAVQKGETFDLEIQMGGRVTPMTYEVIDITAPTRVVLHSETDRLVSHDVITIRETAAGTVLDYDATLSLKGILHLADPVLGVVFRRIADKAVDGLREHVT